MLPVGFELNCSANFSETYRETLFVKKLLCLKKPKTFGMRAEKIKLYQYEPFSFGKCVVMILVFSLSTVSLGEDSAGAGKKRQSRGRINPSVSTNSPSSSKIPKTLSRSGWRRQPLLKTKAHYEACRDVDLSGASKLKTITSAVTVCLDCPAVKTSDFKEIQKADKVIQSKLADEKKAQAFKEELQNRVIEQAQLRISGIQDFRDCITGNDNRVEDCEARKKQLKGAIAKSWPDMRVYLSLRSPALKGERILSRPVTWFDSSPSHSVAHFADLPKLNKKEKLRAKEIYIEALSQVPLEGLTASELRERLQRGKSLHLSAANTSGKYLTKKDEERLRSAAKSLQKESEAKYQQIVSELIVLAYLKNGKPTDSELDQAFGELQEQLKGHLSKLKEPQVDMAQLLFYEPLIEELLWENPAYCPVAERERRQSQKDENFTDQAFLLANVIAGISCAAITAGACLAAISIAGGVGIYEADKRSKEALSRFLTGTQFETLDGLEKASRAALVEKWLFPTTLRGVGFGVAKGARAFSGGRGAVINKARDFQDTRRLAEKSLGVKYLPSEQAAAVHKAHLVGRGKPGKDGGPAQVGNYTLSQRKEKIRILRKAGFLKLDILRLMQDGVVGDDFVRMVSQSRGALRSALNNATDPAQRARMYDNFETVHFKKAHQNGGDSLSDNHLLQAWAEELVREKIRKWWSGSSVNT